MRLEKNMSIYTDKPIIEVASNCSVLLEGAINYGKK